MDVAVIMSVYKNDALDSLIESVDSILEQSYNKIDLFICIDGYIGFDLSEYISKLENNKRIFVIYNKVNLGLAKSLNKLIDTVLESNSMYKYIARMDSDDISHKTRIEKQVDYLETNQNVDVVGTFCREFGSDYALECKKLPVEHQDLKNFSITKCPFIHPTVLFRRYIFDKGIRYPENTSFTEDQSLWFNLLDRGVCFGNLDSVLLDYRLDSNTIKRRQGLSKAISEFRLRFYYMFKLRKVNLKNVFLICSRLIFHILPVAAIRFLYKTQRQ